MFYKICLSSFQIQLETLRNYPFYLHICTRFVKEAFLLHNFDYLPFEGDFRFCIIYQAVTLRRALDMYFLQPYSTQHTLTKNNYAFRDYFQGAIKTNDIYLGNVIIATAASHPREDVVAIPI